jgi:hypothetical protein
MSQLSKQTANFIPLQVQVFNWNSSGKWAIWKKELTRKQKQLLGERRRN